MMKKFLFLILALFISVQAYSVTRIYDRATGDIIDADKDDAEFDNTNNAINTHTADTSAHDATGGVVGVSKTQTLTNKTLTSPIITNSPTAAGATWTNLGTVTTFAATSGNITNATITNAIFNPYGTISGATGSAILGLKAVGVPINLNIVNATTTTANDSIKIECGDAACSATNPGFLWMPSHTPGDRTLFTITSDVTKTLTGAHWGAGGKGDLTDAILRVSAVNAQGSLVWCVNYQGLQGVRFLGSATLDDANTSSNINLPEEIWCNGDIGADDPVVELFWFRADFDDTGNGGGEDFWTVQSGDGDLNTGSADGQWQPFNTTYGGFSAAPTVTHSIWTQIGNTVFFEHQRNALGTSDSVNFTATLPVKAERQEIMGPLGRPTDNTADVTTVTRLDTAAASTTITLYETPGAGTWTGSGSKGADFRGRYEAYRP